MTILAIVGFTTQVKWLIRIIVAALYGVVIGYERTIQHKSAGVRTHIVAAATSALFMIVSKCDLYDLLTTNEIVLDLSGVTAQIVTGISLISIGIILVRREQISDLTTAVGVQATSAIGIVAGSGLRVIGVLAIVFIFFIQMLSHDGSIISRIIVYVRFNIQIVCVNMLNILNEIQNELEDNHVESVAIKILDVDDEQIVFNADGITNSRIDENNIIMYLCRYPDIRRIIYTHGGR